MAKYRIEITDDSRGRRRVVTWRFGRLPAFHPVIAEERDHFHPPSAEAAESFAVSQVRNYAERQHENISPDDIEVVIESIGNHYSPKTGPRPPRYGWLRQ